MSEKDPAPNVKLEMSWKKVLAEEFSKPYMVNLRKFLKQELQKGKTIYPKGEEYFEALNLTPFLKVKVVIIGQDPYHGPGQAPHPSPLSAHRGFFGSKPFSKINAYLSSRGKDQINWKID